MTHTYTETYAEHEFTLRGLCPFRRDDTPGRECWVDDILPGYEAVPCSGDGREAPPPACPLRGAPVLIRVKR
jgi:hypothetical protein